MYAAVELATELYTDTNAADSRKIEGMIKTLEDAMKITRDSVAKELGGLPPIKMHCSNLAADALHKAIENYNSKSKKSEKKI